MSYQQKIKSHIFSTVILVLIFMASGCVQADPTAIPTSTPTTKVATASSVAQNTVTASPQPTIPAARTANPDQLTRWKEYEHALASKLLFLHPPEEILCEWEILGQSGQEVYVWAFCLGWPPTGMSELYAPGPGVPAVIHLESDGSIQSVEIPRDNHRDYVEGINKIFPQYIQENIFNNLISYAALIDHAKFRRENLGPPLIVLSATAHP